MDELERMWVRDEIGHVIAYLGYSPEKDTTALRDEAIKMLEGILSGITL